MDDQRRASDTTNGDAVMSGTYPFAETMPGTEANPHQLRAALPAESFSRRPTGRTVTGRLVSCVAVALGVTLAGCTSAKVVSVDDASNGPASRPTVVYVQDFELAPDSIQSEAPTAALPLHAYLEQHKAESLVATMSTAIVDDLTKKGIAAQRLPANAPLPKQGWLVRGV